MKHKQPIHFADSYLINPTNPILIQLIGAGGTGSQLLTALARMNTALIALNHPGLHVTVWDNDRITHANLGRQLFAESELSMYKSEALINRLNRFFGTNWKAIAAPFSTASKALIQELGPANIYVTCVDTAAARFEISKLLMQISQHSKHGRNKSLYWMDFGNAHHTGQVILSTLSKISQPASKKYQPIGSLPLMTQEFKQLLEKKEDMNEPSCSLAEALTKQDLFINSTLANLGASLLWNLFREGMAENRGFFINLKNFRAQPLPVN